MKFPYFIFIILFQLFSGKSLSQESLFVTSPKNYDAKDGLPSNTIYHILQASDGLLWISTDRGVSVFDGQNFRNYSFEDGLSDYEILSTFQDREGRIWLSTFNGSVLRFSDKKFNTIQLESRLGTSSLIKGYVNTSFGPLLVSSRGNGLKFTNSGVETLELDSGDYRTILVEEYKSTGRLLSVTANEKIRGKIKLQLDSTIVYKTGFYNSIGLYDQQNQLLLINSNGNTSNIEEIELPSLKTRSKQTLPDLNGERPLFMHWQDGKLFLCTRNGLFIYRAIDTGVSTDFQLITSAFESYTVTSILKISDGSWWISTLDEGIFQFELKQEKTKIYDQPVSRIILSKNRLFACGLGEVIEIKNNSAIKIGKLDYREKITDVEVLDDNSTLVSSGLGLFKLSNNLVEQYSFGTGFKDIERSGSKFYIAAFNGVYLFNSKNIHEIDFTPHRIYKERANSIAATEDFLYVGSGKEGHEIELMTGLQCPLLDSYKGRVNKIVVNNQSIWVATAKDGIYKIDNGLTTHFLDDRAIHSIFVYKNNDCWAITNEGLTQLSSSDTKNFEYSEIEVSGKIEDVLQFNENLYIATSEGLYVKTLGELNQESENLKANVYLKNILINGEEYSEKEHLALNHNENNIEINYSSICFKNNRPIHYEYHLLNKSNGDLFNAKTTNEQLSFFDLKAGSYVFSITAFNGDVGGEVIDFGFVINQPFYEKWWFIFLTIFIIVLIITVFVIKRLNRFKNQRQIQQELFNYEQQALRAKMNPHFLFNVLNSIQQFFLKDDSLNGHRYLQKFAQLVRIVLNTTDKTYLSIENEVDYLKRYVELEQLRSNVNFTFEIIIDEKIDPKRVFVPSMTIQPFLENSIWHAFDKSSKDPKISVIFRLSNFKLEITITDNGKGYDRNNFEVRNRHSDMPHGIEIVEERLAVLGKQFNVSTELEITSKTPTGTCIKMITPISYD